MENELQTVNKDQALRTLNQGAMSAVDMQAQINQIQEVMRKVMKPDVHYGKIPGCQKESLYKAGSEVLLTTFHISVEPIVEDMSDNDVCRYRVTAIGRHQQTNVIIGYGIGECSTNEEKYKWRRAVCDEEYDEAPVNMRRIKFGKWNNNVQKTKQIRTNPDDLANTALKMAKKRAQIDLTLTCTAASDIFTQDIEDLPDGYEVDSGQEQQPQGVRDVQGDQSHPDAAKIIADLEVEAEKGWDALQRKWQSLANEQRAIVGAEFGRIKKIADGVTK